MTTDKLTSALNEYWEHVENKYGVLPVEHPDLEWLDHECDSFFPYWEHIAWMCRKCTTEFIPSGDVGKAMRWLGWIQGVFFATHEFTLSELRAHSRSGD